MLPELGWLDSVVEVGEWFGSKLGTKLSLMKADSFVRRASCLSVSMRCSEPARSTRVSDPLRPFPGRLHPFIRFD